MQVTEQHVPARIRRQADAGPQYGHLRSVRPPYPVGERPPLREPDARVWDTAILGYYAPGELPTVAQYQVRSPARGNLHELGQHALWEDGGEDALPKEFSKRDPGERPQFGEFLADLRPVNTGWETAEATRLHLRGEGRGSGEGYVMPCGLEGASKWGNGVKVA